MKVSTDACIQGAWAARQLQEAQALTVLDIGTGTGLLSLMLAQLNPGIVVDAIELNEEAAEQARHNFSASPWSKRLQVYPNALADFRNAHPAQEQYDFIICNPPFFHNQLQAPDKARNDARHSVSLSKTELAGTASALLKPSGTLCVLYPAREWDDWEKAAAQYGLYPQKTLTIHPNSTAAPNRLTGLFSKVTDAPTHKDQLVIYEPDKRYTPAFTDLLQAYYLYL